MFDIYKWSSKYIDILNVLNITPIASNIALRFLEHFLLKLSLIPFPFLLKLSVIHFPFLFKLSLIPFPYSPSLLPLSRQESAYPAFGY